MRRSKALRRAVGALALTLAIMGCGLVRGVHLSASNLEIGPNPAMPGQEVQAVFRVNVAPIQRLTIILTINDAEHLRETTDEVQDGPYVISLGDAAGLITKYGTGMHSARIEVRAEEDNESARTQSYTFELREAVP